MFSFYNKFYILVVIYLLIMSKVNGWKVFSIVLLVIVILESCLIVYSISSALAGEERELDCAVNICSGYDSYNFDWYSDMCYCFLDGEIVYQEFMLE